jgi:hypothetical protein
MAHIPKDRIESLQGSIAEVLAGWSLSGPHSENWVKDVVMVIRYAVVLAVWAWCLCPTSGFAAIDCGPLKPGTTTDTSIEDNLKGHAQVILKSLGSGEIENGYKQTEADTLNKYPNADQLVLWRSYIYLTCSLLQSSTQWNDDQKYDRLIQLINLYNRPPPTEAARTADPRDSLTGQSHGFVIQARCVRAGAPVVCTATIVNQDPSRELLVWVGQTKLFDGNSQAYPPFEASIAGSRGGKNDMLRVKLLQGRPAEAVFRFEGIPSSVRELAELDIRAQVEFQSFTLESAGNISLH